MVHQEFQVPKMEVLYWTLQGYLHKVIWTNHPPGKNPAGIRAFIQTVTVIRYPSEVIDELHATLRHLGLDRTGRTGITREWLKGR